MPFPTSPTNGQTYVLNNTSYTYNSAQGTWTATQAGVSTPIVIAANTAATSATTGALQVVGGIGVQGAVYSNSTVVMGSPFTMRNKIINGAMVIDQRNAGASVTPSAAASTYITDRFSVYQTQASKFSAQQNAGSVTPPAGFSNYLGITSLSAYSVLSTDLFRAFHPIEGYNIADLAWGSSSAKTITLSFYVRSSLTGTFGGCLQNSSNNRAYAFTYSIPSANTWTYITVAIPGETTGSWNTTNGTGIAINWDLGSGSNQLISPGSWQSVNGNGATGCVSIVGTSGATWYITGVQLEVGSAATPFEYRNAQQELALCQRYYEVSQYYWSSAGYADGSGQVAALTNNWMFKVSKRANATITTTTTGTSYNASGPSFRSDITGVNIYGTSSAAGRCFFDGYAFTASAEL